MAALLGIKVVAVASTAAAAVTFTGITERLWGAAAVWAGRLFALGAAAALLTAAFPYTLGFAFALGALAALQRGRRKLFVCFLVLTVAASPLAFVLLVVVLVALALSQRLKGVARPAAAVAAICLAALLVQRLFPSGGRFPYPPGELLAAVAFAAIGLGLTWRVAEARLLRLVFVAYGVACLVCFVLPSPVGENVGRLRYAAVPITVLTLSLRHWRPLVPAVAILALAFSWNTTPLAYSLARGVRDPSATAAYWEPAVRYLSGRLSPSFRVEAVDTVGHWEAVYLPRAGIPLARGVFRQDDFPQNEVLYDRLGRTAYVAWLRQLGVRYVVLTDAPTDYSARSEAELLRSGRSRLPIVERTPTTTIYAVPEPRPIVTGPGAPRVVKLGLTSITIAVHRPGRYRLAVRYSPYWSAGEAACVGASADRMTDVYARKAGLVRLRFAVSASRALSAVAGDERSCDSDSYSGLKGSGYRAAHG